MSQPTHYPALHQLQYCADSTDRALRAAREAGRHLEGARATRTQQLVETLSDALALHRDSVLFVTRM